MVETTTSCQETRSRATNRRYGWLLALSLALLTSALAATLLQAVLSPEAVADDVNPGKWTSFPQSVKPESGEVVVFSYIVYKSRRDRDRITKDFMSDPRMQKYADPKKMPFDGKRMFWGGFKPIVSL